MSHRDAPLDESEVLAGVFAYPRLMLERGMGSWLWDEAGNRYLDFTAGLAVAALGHGRRDLAEILAAQFGTLGHCSNLFGNRPALELATRLKESSFAERIWLCNSGTEANEAALKFARLHGAAAGGSRKNVIVAFRGGFHGRTMGALSLTHHPDYRRPFTPLVGGVRFAAFNDLESVRRVMDARVCAILVEPVQGEGGVVPAAPGFLDELRTLCDSHDALLMFDEVQCGLGRLGTLYAYQAFDVVPDLVTLAKPLAGGLPLGAALVNARVAALLKPGQHGSTFAGNPAVCAVATRVFDLVSAPEFLARVGVAALRLNTGLAGIVEDYPLFRAVRGQGLMQALVLRRPKVRGAGPGDFVAAARGHGLLVTRAGEDAVRFLPPLNVSDEEIDAALERLRTTARGMSAPRRARGLGRAAHSDSTHIESAPVAVQGGRS